MNQASVSDWHRDQYTIYHKDIDFQEVLRLTSLAGMLQETAWNHARQIGLGYDSGVMNGLIWVLSRLDIHWLAPPPAWMDQARVATAPVGIDKLFALRDFAALDATGTVFATARSAWLLIDEVKRSLVRPQILTEHFASHGRTPLDFDFPRKLSAGNTRHQRSLGKAGVNDIDGHQHVNNVSYLVWAMGGYSREFLTGHRLVGSSANFAAELVWGDEIFHAWNDDGLVHSHLIHKGDPAQASAIIEFRWAPR